MSAPDTDVEKQKENHRPALIGLRGQFSLAGRCSWL